MDTKRLQIKQIDEEGTGLAIIATMDAVDSDGDTYAPGAFGSQEAKVLDGHSWGGPPLGKARIYEDGNRAMAEFRLNLDTTAGREWHKALKFDLDKGRPLQEWSYGFQILDSDTETRNGDRVRVLKRLSVYEVSPVVLGAGKGTRTLSIKSRADLLTSMAQIAVDLDGVMAETARIAAERQEQGKAFRPAWADNLRLIKGRLDAFLAEIDKPTEAAEAEARQLYASFTRLQSRIRGAG